MPDRETEQEQQGVWIEYWRLSRLEESMREDNPKEHDLGLIHTGINRHGFRGAVMIDERTKKLQAGHGRITSLRQKQDSGEAPPAGIRMDRDGEWLVPVLRGEEWRSEADARGFVTLDNQATIAGGWNDPLLVEFLQATLDEVGDLEGTGFDGDDLDALLAALNGAEAGGAPAAGAEPPDGFSSYDDESIPTEHTCPSCGYKWSGGK